MQTSYVPMTDAKDAKPTRAAINIVGFDGDETLWRLMMGGILLFCADNRDEQQALKPVFVELLGGAARANLVKALKKRGIHEIFIHTEGTKFILVDKKGKPYPPLFLSGPDMGKVLLDHWLGDERQDIIPDRNIHCYNTRARGYPVEESRLALSQNQYDDLKEDILAFRNKFLIKVGNQYQFSSEAFDGYPQWSKEFLNAYEELVEWVQSQPNIVNFYKPLKPHQSKLVAKAQHFSFAIDVIADVHPAKEIDNLIGVDDRENNCLALVASRNEFPQVKRVTWIEHLNPSPLNQDMQKDAWSVAIPLILNPTQKNQELLKEIVPFFSDFRSLVMNGLFGTVAKVLKIYDHYGLLKEKLQEISQHIIAVANAANALTHREDLDKKTALHRKFFILLDSLIYVVKDDSDPVVLKIVYQIFREPAFKQFFSLMTRENESFSNYFLETLFGRYLNEESLRTSVFDRLATYFFAPLTSFRFFLQCIPGSRRVVNPAGIVSRLLVLERDQKEKDELIRYLVQDARLNPMSMISPELCHYVHPLINAIDNSADEKNRFSLCEFLLERGFKIDNIIGTGMINLLIKNHNFEALKFFCDNPHSKADLNLYNRYPQMLPLEAAALEKQKKPSQRTVAIFDYLSSKLKSLPSVSSSSSSDRKNSSPPMKVVLGSNLLKLSSHSYLSSSSDGKDSSTPMSDDKTSYELKAPPENKFDPILIFVMHLSIHAGQFDPSRLDELLHYARWYLVTKGRLEQLIATVDRHLPNFNIDSFVLSMRQLIADRKPPEPLRPFAEVRKEIEAKNHTRKKPLSSEEIDDFSGRVTFMHEMRGAKTSFTYPELKAHFKQAVDACRKEFKETNRLSVQKNSHNKDELCALLREMHWRSTGCYPNDLQMFNLLAFIHDSPRELGEIPTGQGKTMLFGLAAAGFKWITEWLSDYGTSHEHLAETATKELSEFFYATGTTFSHFTKEECFPDLNADVLIATYEAFKELQMNKETRINQGRGNRPYHVFLGDEVDTVLIDGRTIRYQCLFGGDDNRDLISFYRRMVKFFKKQPEEQLNLSVYIRKLAQEEGITLGRMDLKSGRLIDKEEKGKYLTETQAEEEFLEKMWKGFTSEKERQEFFVLVSDEVRIEFYKKVFKALDDQVERVLSLNSPALPELELDNVRAKTMFIDLLEAKKYIYGKDYWILYDASTGKPEQIEFFDEHSGELAKRRRDRQRHTFLEIMHGVSPRVMEAIVSKTSDVSYLNRYPCIRGAMGVLREEHDQKELEADGYELFYSTSYHKTAVTEEAPIIVPDHLFEETLIKEMAKRQSNRQPVMTFNDSPKMCEEFTAMFAKEFGQDKAQVLHGVQKKRTEEVAAQAGRPGKMTNTTNVGGRGLNVNIRDGDPPLHLFFTCLFPTRRAEGQAIGRAGRYGKKGSYNYLLPASKVCQSLGWEANQENIDYVCNNPTKAIAQHYENIRKKATQSAKRNEPKQKLEKLQEQIQHLYFGLPEELFKITVYRWSEYITDLDDSYDEKLRAIPTSQLHEKGTRIILDGFVNFWKACDLSQDQLWKLLAQEDNAELRKTFIAFQHKPPSDSAKESKDRVTSMDTSDLNASASSQSEKPKQVEDKEVPKSNL